MSRKRITKRSPTKDAESHVPDIQVNWQEKEKYFSIILLLVKLLVKKFTFLVKTIYSLFSDVNN